MRDYLELCAQYNSNLTVTSSTARRCRATVYVLSVDESLTSEGGLNRTNVALRIGLVVNVIGSYEVVNATVLQT